MDEQALRELQDIAAIQRLKAVYCQASDHSVHGLDAVGAVLERVFTEDVSANVGVGPVEGRDAMIASMVATSDVMEALWHAIHSPQIRVAGDEAEGQWTVIVRAKPKGAPDWITMYGRYQDRFRRTADGWRISSALFVGDEPSGGSLMGL